VSITTTAHGLADYEIVGELGRGGMGIVYLAIARGMAGFAKPVVIKKLHPALENEAGFREAFLHEARLGAKLSHPGIAQVHRILASPDGLSTVFEYLEGPSLRAIWRGLAEDRALVCKLSLSVLIEVLDALDYAHRLTDREGRSLGIVHRDVTPHNIIVTLHGHAKLFDFGIAKTALGPEQTRPGVIKGKTGYMAPEQAAGAEVDGRTDVFSAGVILWEALTGRRFWSNKSATDILYSLFDRAPLAAPREVDPEIDPILSEICAKAIARIPEDRFASARELRDALEERVTALGMRMTTRELAEVVNTTFATTRDELRAKLEAHREASASSPSRVMSVLYPPSSMTNMLAVETGARFSTAPPVSLPTPQPSPSPLAAPRSKRVPLALGAGGALLVALGAVGVLQLKRSTRPDARIEARTPVVVAGRIFEKDEVATTASKQETQPAPLWFRAVAPRPSTTAKPNVERVEGRIVRSEL
jgi:serine/threonine protein kinase